MTAETIHTCSYECERPECIRAQRDELAARMAVTVTPDEIAEMVRKAVESERERCARVCESLGGNGPGYIDDDWARMCADAIRGSRAQQPEARGVVDEGSRSVTNQLLHWGGIPVRVTGTVTTSPGNWPLIDAALTETCNDR